MNKLCFCSNVSRTLLKAMQMTLTECPINVTGRTYS